MNAEPGFLGPVLIALACLDAIALVSVMVEKACRRRAYSRTLALNAELRAALLAADGAALRAMARRDLASYTAALRQAFDAISESGPSRKAAIDALVEEGGLEAVRRQARSVRKHKRLRAYLALGMMGGAEAAKLLLERLADERSGFCRLVAARQLALCSDAVEIGALVAVVERLDPPPGDKDYAMLEPLGSQLARHFAALSPEARRTLGERSLRLYLMGMEAKPSEAAWRDAADLAESAETGLAERALSVMASAYPPSWFLDAYLERREPRFMRPCARLLGAVLPPADLYVLDPWFERPGLRAEGQAAAEEILRRHPESAGGFLSALAEGSDARAVSLALALEHKLSFLAFHQEAEHGEGFVRLVTTLLSLGRTGAILAVLEAPIPEGSRGLIVEAVRVRVREDERARDFFSRHGNARLCEELSLGASVPEEDKRRIPVRPADKIFLAAFVSVALCAFPAVFAAMRWSALGYLSSGEILHRFVMDFHYLFAWYTIAVKIGRASCRERV